MPVDFSKIPSPCFVLDEKLLINNLHILRKVQEDSGAGIILALKGYALHYSFPLIKKYLKGISASSLHEARLGFEEFGNNIHLYSPAYRDDEFNKLIKYSRHITFNSLSQWEHFKQKISASDNNISCGIRINPEHSEVATDLYNPCMPGSRLGISADQLKDGLPAGVEGLHFHALCEKDSFALERVLQAVEEKFSVLLPKVKWVNMGGGHLITDKNYDRDHLIQLIKKFKEKHKVEVILEPGAAIGWQTGYLVSTILDITENRGIRTAMLDTSFTAHMPDCLEQPYKPKIMNASDPVPGKPTYRMGGLTCLAGDQLGNYSFDKILKVGDKLVFMDMMHYTMVKTTTFNGVNLPSIGVWKADDRFSLIKSFGYEDYKNRLS
jgi:carboxynorspermidine decarboxylase